VPLSHLHFPIPFVFLHCFFIFFQDVNILEQAQFDSTFFSGKHHIFFGYRYGGKAVPVLAVHWTLYHMFGTPKGTGREKLRLEWDMGNGKAGSIGPIFF